MIASLKNFSIDKSNWPSVKFGDVVFEPKESVKDPVAAGVKHVVGLEHIDSEDMHLRRSATIEESTTFTKRFRVGDVLFGRRRAYLKKAAHAEFEGICSGDIIVMRTRETLLPELLPFIVNNDKFFDFAIKHSAGGLSPRVKFKSLAEYELRLPPLVMQSKLLGLLLSSEVMRRSTHAMLSALHNFRRSYLRDKIRQADFIFLSELSNVYYGLGQPPEKDSNGVPVIRATDIQRGEIDESNFLRIKASAAETKKNAVIQEGDIIIVRSGAYTGDLALIPEHLIGAVAGYDLIIRHFKGKISPKFLAEYLLDGGAQQYFKRESIRSAQPHLNSKQVLGTMVPNLDYSVQEKIERQLIEFDTLRDSLRDKKRDAVSMQNALLRSIF